MTTQPAAARQALLATLAYVTIVLVVAAWAIANDAAYRELRVAYDVKSEMLDALKKRRLVDRSKDASAAGDIATATIQAPTETVAASVLQRYLLDRLESAGGSVQSVQAEAKSETVSPGLQRLSAQVAFDATIAALQRFLFDLESGLPFVFVDSLAAQPAPTVQQEARAGDKVRVALTVTSYWKADARAGVDR